MPHRYRVVESRRGSRTPPPRTAHQLDRSCPNPCPKNAHRLRRPAPTTTLRGGRRAEGDGWANWSELATRLAEFAHPVAVLLDRLLPLDPTSELHRLRHRCAPPAWQVSDLRP